MASVRSPRIIAVGAPRGEVVAEPDGSARADVLGQRCSHPHGSNRQDGLVDADAPNVVDTTTEQDELAEADTAFYGVPLHRGMGFEVVQRIPHAVVRMQLSEDVRGPFPGTVHGGVVATLADVNVCDRPLGST
jgi:hypothetical protein